MEKKRMIRMLAFWLLMGFLLFPMGCTKSTTMTENSEAEQADMTDYPTKTVELIVPFSAGGGTDTLARLVASELEKEWGKTVLVVNKPGGNSAIGINEVYKSKPDGYVIGVTTNTDFPNLILNGEMITFTMSDFNFLARCNTSSLMLVASKESGLKTWADVKDAALDNPGKLTVAVSGKPAGLLLMLEKTKIDLTQISFNSGSERVNAVLGGHVDLAVLDKKFYNQMIENGAACVGIYAEDRLDVIPDLKTFKEQGVDVASETFRIFFVPKNVPADVCRKITNSIQKVTSTAEFNQKLLAVNEVYKFEGGEDAKAAMAATFTEVESIN